MRNEKVQGKGKGEGAGFVSILAAFLSAARKRKEGRKKKAEFGGEESKEGGPASVSVQAKFLLGA